MSRNRYALLGGLCSVFFFALARPATSGGCNGSVSVGHGMSAIGPQAGAFDLGGTAYADKPHPGPSLRFWAFQNFAKANSGEQDQLGDIPWLTNASVEIKGVKDAVPHGWFLQNPDWYGKDISGCPLDLPEADRRTVVELSFADPAREGTKDHQGFFVVVSVPISGAIFNFDDVRGGGGAAGNVIPAAAIPAPKVTAAAKPANGYAEVSLELPAVVSYSEKGKDAPVRLIKGYRLLAAEGAEPTSSDPSKYQAVRDPKDPKKELGTVKPGSVTVAVASKGEALWLVSQLVYEDPAPLYSRATSAHVRVGEGAKTTDAGGTGHKRGEGGRSR